jgi:hypothetical protein
VLQAAAGVPGPKISSDLIVLASQMLGEMSEPNEVFSGKTNFCFQRIDMARGMSLIVRRIKRINAILIERLVGPAT